MRPPVLLEGLHRSQLTFSGPGLPIAQHATGHVPPALAPTKHVDAHLVRKLEVKLLPILLADDLVEVAVGCRILCTWRMKLR